MPTIELLDCLPHLTTPQGHGNHMRLATTAAFLLLVSATVSAQNRPVQPGASSGSEKALIVGTWRLVLIDDNGRPDSLRGAHPTGLIFYDGTGHMAVQIAPDRPRPSWPPNQRPTAQQALDAVVGYGAYFGTYTVDERAHIVTHHREAALNLDVVDYVRRYAFAGPDTLALLPVETSGRKLVWVRVK
jgi:hypothetical protein